MWKAALHDRKQGCKTPVREQPGLVQDKHEDTLERARGLEEGRQVAGLAWVQAAVSTALHWNSPVGGRTLQTITAPNTTTPHLQQSWVREFMKRPPRAEERGPLAAVACAVCK